MYFLDIKPAADKIFRKLAKKNPAQLRMVDKKIQQILDNPHHKFKFLRKPLQLFNRVHIDKHFVLIFRIYPEKKAVVIYYYGHHDDVYDWNPKYFFSIH